MKEKGESSFTFNDIIRGFVFFCKFGLVHITPTNILLTYRMPFDCVRLRLIPAGFYKRYTPEVSQTKVGGGVGWFTSHKIKNLEVKVPKSNISLG